MPTKEAGLGRGEFQDNVLGLIAELEFEGGRGVRLDEGKDGEELIEAGAGVGDEAEGGVTGLADGLAARFGIPGGAIELEDEAGLGGGTEEDGEEKRESFHERGRVGEHS